MLRNEQGEWEESNGGILGRDRIDCGIQSHSWYTRIEEMKGEEGRQTTVD
jgi:hypothetical protein